MSNLDAANGFPARLSTRLSFLVAGLVMSSWAPLVPYAKARLDLDDSAFGLLLLCLGIGSVLAMQITGAVVARIGSRPMVLIGGSGLCLTLPLLAFASTTSVLAICLLVFGASLGSIDVAMNVHFTECTASAVSSGRPVERLF
jgi:predicted MFS family arabinose efflux permease